MKNEWFNYMVDCVRIFVENDYKITKSESMIAQKKEVKEEKQDYVIEDVLKAVFEADPEGRMTTDEIVVYFNLYVKALPRFGTRLSDVQWMKKRNPLLGKGLKGLFEHRSHSNALRWCVKVRSGAVSLE